MKERFFKYTRKDGLEEVVAPTVHSHHANRTKHDSWAVETVKKLVSDEFLCLMAVMVAFFCVATCWYTSVTIRRLDAAPVESVTVVTNEQGSAKLAVPVPAVEVEPDNVLFYNVPEAESGQKTWMDYRSITCQSSVQWSMQQEAWTDENGFRRFGESGLYMVAVGSFYAQECGKVLTFELENGTVLQCIVSDIKKDADTDVKNQHSNGNVLEFVVDRDVISRDCLVMGDMSYADEAFMGEIVAISCER